MKEFKELAASGFEKFPADVLFKKKCDCHENTKLGS